MISGKARDCQIQNIGNELPGGIDLTIFWKLLGEKYIFYRKFVMFAPIEVFTTLNTQVWLRHWHFHKLPEDVED